MGDINVSLGNPTTAVTATLASGVNISAAHPQLHVEERTRLEDLRVKVVNDDATASAIVYLNEFRGSGYVKPSTSAANMTWKADGTGDNAEVQAAIDAVASFGGGSVKIVGPLGVAAAGVKIRTGVKVYGEGLGTEWRASANFTGDTGMFMLYDGGTHATELCNLHINGNDKAVHGVHYIAKDGQIFTTKPATNPDPVHNVHDLLITKCGTTSFGGHGLIAEGPNLRGNRYTNLSIRFVTGTAVWVRGSVDSHYTDIDCGSPGDSTLGFSSDFNNPLGYGFYIGKVVYDVGGVQKTYGGDQNVFKSCKPWYCYGDGFYVAGVRNRFMANEAQDNHGYGFNAYYGKNTYVGCVADSNGQSNGTLSRGRDGFNLNSDGNIVVGCMAFDKAEGQTSGWQQQYGFRFGSGFTNSRAIACATYGNEQASYYAPAGGIPASSTIDIVSLDGK